MLTAATCWANSHLKALILFHHTGVKLSSMRRHSRKSICSLISEEDFLPQHNLDRILGTKNGLSSMKTKQMISQTSSHCCSGHQSTKKSRTKYG